MRCDISTALAAACVFHLAAALPGDLFKRECSRNNCVRAVAASSAKPGPASATADCTTFVRQTVSPCPVTSTATVTMTVVAQAVTSTSTSTSTMNSATTSTSTSTITTTTVTTSLSVSTATAYSTTSTVTSAGPIAQAKIKRAPACSPITTSSTAIPTYASACSNYATYSSACSCNGVVPSATTLATPTSTITSTVTSTTTPTVRATATTATVLVASSVTTTMTTSTATSISTVVSTTTVTTATTTTVQPTGLCPNTQANGEFTTQPIYDRYFIGYGYRTDASNANAVLGRIGFNLSDGDCEAERECAEAAAEEGAVSFDVHVVFGSRYECTYYGARDVPFSVRDPTVGNAYGFNARAS